MHRSTTRSRARGTIGKIAAIAIAATLVQLPLATHATAEAAKAALPTSASASSAAVTSSAGQEFWLAIPSNNFGLSTPIVTISTMATGTGTISMPGKTWTQTFSFTPGSQTRLFPPEHGSLESDGTTSLGIHITATADITVTVSDVGFGLGEAFVALPVDGLGLRYRVLAYSSTVSQLTVVATQDDTQVTVTPANSSGTRAAGVPYTVGLDQGQVYQLVSNTDTTGTVIEATAEIAVFGSARCSQIPAGIGNCNQIAQQLPPTFAWGTDFLSARLVGRAKGDTYRVLANEDDTQISVNGSWVATIDAGEHWESVLPADAAGPQSEAVSIQTSQPALVAQYANSVAYDSTSGGPLMMLVPPIDQYLDTYAFYAPDFVGYTANANVVVPTDDVGLVTLDGVAIPAVSFDEVTGTEYSAAQLSDIDPGSHEVAGPSPLGVQVYEFGSETATGFGYPASMGLSKIYRATSTTVLTSTGIGTAQQSTTVTVPDGSTVRLLNGDDLVDAVTVGGEGTYALDANAGVITFTPDDAFVGTTTGVTYVVTDKYDQATTGTYVATVEASAALTLEVPAISRLTNQDPDTLTVDCVMSRATAKVCKVKLRALVNGRLIAVGQGLTRLRAADDTLSVAVLVSKRGQRLASRSSGLDVTLLGGARLRAANPWNTAIATTHLTSSTT